MRKLASILCPLIVMTCTITLSPMNTAWAEEDGATDKSSAKPSAEKRAAAKERARGLQQEMKEAKEAGDQDRVREIRKELYQMRQARKRAKAQGGPGKGPREPEAFKSLPQDVRDELRDLHGQIREARESGDQEKARELRKQAHGIMRDNGVEPPKRRGPRGENGGPRGENGERGQGRERDGEGGPQGRRGPPRGGEGDAENGGRRRPPRAGGGKRGPGQDRRPPRGKGGRGPKGDQ